MDENQNSSVAVLPHGHPPFLFFAVLLVKDGNGPWIKKELGSTLEADPVLTLILLLFDAIPLESVAQLSPTVWINNRNDRERPGSCQADLDKTVPGRPDTKPPTAAPGDNRFDCNDFSHVQQLSCWFRAHLSPSVRSVHQTGLARISLRRV